MTQQDNFTHDLSKAEHYAGPNAGSLGRFSGPQPYSPSTIFTTTVKTINNSFHICGKKLY